MSHRAYVNITDWDVGDTDIAEFSKVVRIKTERNGAPLAQIEIDIDFDAAAKAALRIVQRNVDAMVRRGMLQVADGWERAPRN